MHDGKDAGLSGAFGVAGGSAGTQVMQRNLTRLTIVIAVLFALNSILLGFRQRPLGRRAAGHPWPERRAQTDVARRQHEPFAVFTKPSYMGDNVGLTSRTAPRS